MLKISINLLILLFLIIVDHPVFAHEYRNFLKVHIYGNNHLLEYNKALKIEETDRFILTYNNYRLRLKQDKSCDPRTIATVFPKDNTLTAKRCTKTMTPAPTNYQFRTRWDPYKHKYDPGFVTGENWNIRKVRLGLLRKESGGWTRKAKYLCKWTIDGKLDNSLQPCRFNTVHLKLGQHSAQLDVFKEGDFKFTTQSFDFEIRDVLIVAMGDSFGSGEGNPHTYIGYKTSDSRYKNPRPALWLDPRCHRSLFSSSGLTSALLADANRGVSFSLINTACSGAETGFGLLKSYYGRETWRQSSTLWTHTRKGRPKEVNVLDEGFFGFNINKIGSPQFGNKNDPAPLDIKPQIDQLKAILACDIAPCRKPDVLLLYIGVNDIQFTTQLVQLILRCERKQECLEKQQKLAGEGIDRIRSNLKTFAAKLKSEKLTPEHPSSIYVITYPNPLTRKGSEPKKYNYCDIDKLFLDGDNHAILEGLGRLLKLGISKEAAIWANDNLLEPLNTVLKETASDQGWTIVDTEQSMLENGVCSDNRFFNTLFDSDEKQGSLPKDYVINTLKCRDGIGSITCETVGQVPLPTGTMHPNLLGHRQIASEIMKCIVSDPHIAPNSNLRVPGISAVSKANCIRPTGGFEAGN